MKKTFYRKLTYIGLYLAILCLLSVLAFRFPSYLSNPMLREVYEVEVLRLILYGCLYLSFGLSLIGLLFARNKKLAMLAIFISVLATALGGSVVEVKVPIQQNPVYLSLDLIILDLLLMSIVFVPMERLFFLLKQRFLREGLATDVSHYALNHLLMGGVFMLIVWPGNWLHQHVFQNTVPDIVQQMPIWSQVICIFFVADFAQYWIHRYFHKDSRCWQFHKIHHSTEKMDWLAGSRLHIMDVITIRAFSYLPIVCLGFSPEAVQIYLPIIAIQAVFVQSNVRFNFGPLRYVLTTPLVHHWHHSSEDKALDKNFAVTFSVLDVIFGTYYCPREWPLKYGLYGERISSNFIKQLIYPFITSLRKQKA